MALHTLADMSLTTSPQPLSSTSVRAAWVSIQAQTAAGTIRVGDKNISSTRGGIIFVVQGYFFHPTLGNANAYDLSDIYVLSSNAGDKVAILYDTN